MGVLGEFAVEPSDAGQPVQGAAAVPTGVCVGDAFGIGHGFLLYRGTGRTGCVPAGHEQPSTGDQDGQELVIPELCPQGSLQKPALQPHFVLSCQAGTG